MSRYYQMDITIKDIKNDDDKDTIIEVIQDQWGLDDDPYIDGTTLTITSNGSLCGGETEEEFADRIAKAIWGKIKYYVPVEVRAAYLEEIPYEIHSRDKEEYNKWFPPNSVEFIKKDDNEN